MAIKTSLAVKDNNPLVSLCSLDSSKAGNSTRLVKIDFATTNCKSKHWKSKKQPDSYKSPYFYEDNYRLYSRTTEKDVVHVNEYSKVPSSFSLAGKVYKANSDEFKPVKSSQKKKKSVLTLPNQKVLVPRNCTVSDMNDSEYCNQDNNRKAKTKKRNCPSNVVSRQKKPEHDCYNCYLNVNMDSSSTTLTKICSKGKKSNATKKKKHNREQQSRDNGKQFNTHDMWSVLKNMNKLQFKPSPPASEDSNSIFFPKNINARRGFKNIPKSRKSTSYAETCRTEEFAYISSIEVDSRCPRSFSHSSSFDRLTVINNEEDIENIFTAIREKHEIPTSQPASKNEYINKRNEVDGKRQKKKRQKINDLHSINNDNKSVINVIVCSKSTSEESEPVIGKGTKKIIKNHRHLKNLPEIESKPIKQQLDGKISSVKNMNQPHKSLLEQKINEDTVGNSRKVCKNQVKNYNRLNNVNFLSKIPVKQLEISDTTEQNNGRSSKIMIEKSTLTDVKDIANIKYPLVIIGVHQFTSTKCVSDGDPPKVTWINNDNYIDEEKIWQLIVKRDSVAVKIGRTMNKQKPTQNTKPANNASENKFVISNKPKETMKHNPIRQFRDSILQFLQKKSSAQSCKDDNKTLYKGVTCTSKSNVNNMNLGKLKSNEQSHKKDISIKEQASKVSNFGLKPSLARNPRTKGKWANDFVENVIKKIKNGIYYTRDLKEVNKTNLDVSTRELAKVEASHYKTQSDINIREDDNHEIPVVTVSKKIASIKTIPGFDDDLPDLEVITINTNKIEIKHFLTNITLQFDVLSADNVIERRMGPKNLLENINGNANLFKCKNAILNPVLPEELCTVLPKMIHGLLAIIKPKTSVLLPLKKAQKFQPKLIGAEPMRSIISLPEKSNAFVNGAFGNSMNIPDKPRFTNFRFFNELMDSEIAKNVLPILRSPFWQPVILNTVHVKRTELFSNREIMCKKSLLPTSSIKRREKCRDLIPYYPKSMWLQSQTRNVFIDRNDFFRILGYLWTFYKTIVNAINEIHSNSYTKDLKYNVVSTNIHICNHQMLNNNFFVITNPLNKSNNVFHVDFYKQINNLTGVKCIEYYSANNGREHSSDNSKSQYRMQFKKSNINKKLKSKSVSDIDSENLSKSINEIFNIEDFFELLGSKSLSNVFSEHVTKNILQCLIEMEDWTAEINSKQALLIVLLVNKKETTNLMRFKSILLQGIAMNRIAHACELDMEIEVIEAENIEFSQYEGISYIPASVQNRDRLFEELHWIAKTTAADYQRPFDASGEKLLRSLLEKRKKLNPSYLRVIARYVGLGLLKSPDL